MASIRKHCAGWKACVHRKGYPYISKHFPHKDHAVRWAQQVEAEMEPMPHYSDLYSPYISKFCNP